VTRILGYVQSKLTLFKWLSCKEFQGLRRCFGGSSLRRENTPGKSPNRDRDKAKNCLASRPKLDGLVIVDPDAELDFLHDLPVELMWGVGPVTRARLADIGLLTIGQLARTPGWSLQRLLGPAASEKLTALAWNRDPRHINTRRPARSAGAQSVRCR
jgi:IMS family HHH motif